MAAEVRYAAIRRQRNLSIAATIGLIVAATISTVAGIHSLSSILYYLATAMVIVVMVNSKRTRRAFLGLQAEKSVATGKHQTGQHHA